MISSTPTDDPLRSAFAPWRYMLAVDEVNYGLDELVARARRGGPPAANLASGVNLLRPPERLLSFVVHAAADPLFWHDYDGPHGHVLGRAAVAACETVRAGGAAAVGPDNVLVTAGASAAMSLVCQGLGRLWAGAGRPGAVLPVPTFPLAGACLAESGFDVVEVVSAEPGRWLPSVDELVRAFTEDTRLVYVNTFNNPSGECYGEADLRRLVGHARAHGVVVLHDTVSSDVARSEPLPHLPSLAAAAGYPDGVVTVGSMSKTRAMPGIRVGWLIADAELVTRLARRNELAAPSSPSIATPALVLDRLATAVADQCLVDIAPADARRTAWHAFRGLVEPYLGAMPELTGFLTRVAGELDGGGVADELVGWRAALGDVLAANVALLATDFADVVTDLPPWRGDFNTFVRVPALDGRDHLTTTHRLFREHGLQTLPAPVFGRDETWWGARGYHTRLSFALPTEDWVDALRRLRDAVAWMRRLA